MVKPGKGEGQLCELDRRYRDRLRKFFRRRGCAAAVAQDLTQDVFLRVIAYRRAREIDNEKTFVFQIAANLLRDKARSTRRWNVSTLAEDARTGEPRLMDVITPERIVEGRQNIGVVAKALGTLDLRTRRIFLMNRIDDLRHRAIADRLGLSVSLVEKSLRGARRHLETEYRREVCA